MTKIITLTTNNFILTGEKYVATVTASSIGFNSSRYYRVSKFLRLIDGIYCNVILSYEITTDGNLLIYSDEPITGRVVLNTDQ